MNIYTTGQWKGFGRQNYYYNQYRLEEETVVGSWAVNDESMPDWLKGYVVDAI